MIKIRKIMGYILLITLLYTFREMFYNLEYLQSVLNKFTLLGNLFIALCLIGVIPKKMHLSAVLSSLLILGVMLTFLSEDILAQEWNWLTVHYIFPIYLLLDYLFFYDEKDYKYFDVLYALIVPTTYFVYTYFYWLITSEVSYSFVDFGHRTPLELISVILIIILVFLLIGLILVFIKKLINKKVQS